MRSEGGDIGSDNVVAAVLIIEIKQVRCALQAAALLEHAGDCCATVNVERFSGTNLEVRGLQGDTH